MHLPKILDTTDPQQSAKAIDHLRHYFGLDGTAPFTGSRFESLGGGGDSTATANKITAEDIVSLSMLSIRVYGRAARDLLENEDVIADIAGYFEQIPADLDLADANADTFASESPASHLWRRLRSLHRVGPTTTSKLMARKRPRLIPVYDSVIKRAFDMPHSGPQWTFWHDSLTADDRALHKRLLSLRTQAGLPERISALRVLDVVAWMEHRSSDEEGDEAVSDDK